MLAVEVNKVSKSFNGKKAVIDLSFGVNQGEIFGLIGPNGAGKSTTIKMMMDIIQPDSGGITVLGEKLSDATKNKLGYMPEERGLYKKLKIMDCILYLASLKGMDKRIAAKQADKLLEITGMMSHKNKKIDELSKGMGQIIQFIVTIIHEPQLVILDEPFSGLDPVNTELLRQMVLDLRKHGRAVILSTHRMNEIEELCDRILMINNGQAVLYGGLAEIKSRYRNHSVIVELEGQIGELTGVIEKRMVKNVIELLLDQNTSPQQILQRLISSGVSINRFEISSPSLNEIFIKVAGKSHE